MSGVTWSPKQREIITAPYDHTIDWLEGTPRSGKTTAAIARFTDHLITCRDTNHLIVAYSAEQAYTHSSYPGSDPPIHTCPSPPPRLCPLGV